MNASRIFCIIVFVILSPAAVRAEAMRNLFNQDAAPLKGLQVIDFTSLNHMPDGAQKASADAVLDKLIKKNLASLRTQNGIVRVPLRKTLRQKGGDALLLFMKTRVTLNGDNAFVLVTLQLQGRVALKTSKGRTMSAAVILWQEQSLNHISQKNIDLTLGKEVDLLFSRFSAEHLKANKP